MAKIALFETSVAFHGTKKQGVQSNEKDLGSWSVTLSSSYLLRRCSMALEQKITKGDDLLLVNLLNESRSPYVSLATWKRKGCEFEFSWA